MVKNKGFLPSGPSEIPVQRSQMKEIISSLLPACKEPDIDSGVRFKADTIMANPTALGHTHVAEALQIPIHIFFTMPWSPTADFPHPLSRIKQQAGYRVSYQIVDLLIWLGMRDMINDLRKKKLKLRPVTYLSGSQGFETDIPHAYMWSPHLVPKPKGWSSLHRALHFGHLAVASILLQHGASITLEDSKSRIHVDLISGNVFQVFENEHSSVATELFSWGSGANYQLGTGNEHIQKLPCKVDSLNGSIIKLISAAKFHSVALTDRGEVNTWGFRRGGRLGHPDFDVHRGTAWAHFCGYTTHTS